MSTSSPSYPGVYIEEAPTPVNNEHRVSNEHALSHQVHTYIVHTSAIRKRQKRKGFNEWDIRGPTIQRIINNIICSATLGKTEQATSTANPLTYVAVSPMSSHYGIGLVRVNC